MPRLLSFRLRFGLILIIALLSFAVAAVTMFSNIWAEQTRAFGLLSLKRRLDLLPTTTANNTDIERFSFMIEKGEWAVLLSQEASGKHRWIKAPTQYEAEPLLQAIQRTRLSEGSFETILKTPQDSKKYLVAFRTSPEGIWALGTQAYKSYLDLSPWAAPFFGTFTIILGLALVLVLLVARQMTAAFTKLVRAMENVAAGRTQSLDLPESKAPEIDTLSKALGKMVQILESRERRIAEVSKLADHDPMTGLPNYRAFSSYMSGLLSNAKSKSDAVSVLCIVDLDYFKKINDTYGHQVGDFVLKQVADLIAKQVRTEAKPNQPDRVPDFYARYGGEEFVVIYSNCDPKQAHVAPLRLMQAIKTLKLLIPSELSVSAETQELAVSASVGMAVWDSARFKTQEEWIKEADKALYQAKRRGRARLIRLHPEVTEWI
jgi:diguanylate cyclase (GGDEF)-like protein